mgnify:CR=1 FL=1
MEDRQQHQTKQSWLRRHLPAIMLLLFVVQPVMDVLSFGLTQCGVSNTAVSYTHLTLPTKLEV